MARTTLPYSGIVAIGFVVALTVWPTARPDAQTPTRHIEGIDAPSPGAPGKTLSSPLVVHFQLRP